MAPKSEIFSSSLLETKNIESYYGPIMALKGVSLKVKQGQIVTVLGANGAGKTTSVSYTHLTLPTTPYV